MLAWIGTQHSQPRWHYITELCWSESLPMCCEQRTSCKMQQESVSLQHALQTFTEKKHTHACLDSISLWGPSTHVPASYANSNPITTKCPWPYPKTLRPLMWCTATMSSLCRWNAFPALHHRTCHEQKIHFHVKQRGCVSLPAAPSADACLQYVSDKFSPDGAAATFRSSLGKCNEVKCHNNPRSSARLQLWQPASAHRCPRSCVCSCTVSSV